MTTRFDEKGKYFSTVISKIQIPVLIQTTQDRIEGNYHIRPEDRIKDAINDDDIFIVLTEAIIFNLEGDKLYEIDFLVINREKIIWILPTNGS